MVAIISAVSYRKCRRSFRHPLYILRLYKTPKWKSYVNSELVVHNLLMKQNVKTIWNMQNPNFICFHENVLKTSYYFKKHHI